VYSFRFAHPSDLPWLEQAMVHSAFESLTPEERSQAHPQVVANQARQQMQGALSGGGGTALVATAWNQPAGFFLAAVNPDSTTGETNVVLLSLWVAPAFRRRGIGSALLRVGEDLFLRHGLRKMKLIAGLHNQSAVRLAQRAGYAPEGLIGIKDL